MENIGADIIRPVFDKKAPLSKGAGIFKRLRLKMTGGFCINYRLNLMGWDYNPSVAVGDTSLCTREAALRVAWESLFRLFCNKLQKIHLPLREG